VFSTNGHLFIEYNHLTGQTSAPRPLAERTQALTALNNLSGSDATEVFEDADGRNNARNARMHIATYQTLERSASICTAARDAQRKLAAQLADMAALSAALLREAFRGTV
jgi:hypothetical protein